MSLKKGDTGAAVADLQRRLTKAGYSVEPDGWFGGATEQALLAFQKDHMITAIGQAGPRTLAALLGSERGNQLTINHMQSGADLLGLPLATMATVAQVESIGEGFTDATRPVVLFERHVFYKQLTKHLGKGTADQMAAHYPNPLLVVMGTTLGMLIADVPAVFAGDKLADKIPMKLVHSIAAAIFAALGIATLLGAGARLGF